MKDPAKKVNASDLPRVNFNYGWVDVTVEDTSQNPRLAIDGLTITEAYAQSVGMKIASMRYFAPHAIVEWSGGDWIKVRHSVTQRLMFIYNLRTGQEMKPA